MTKKNDGVFEFADDDYNLVPEGRYNVRFSEYRTMHMLQGIPKIELRFEICDEKLEYNGLVISKWYNCKECKNPRKNGDFKVGKRSNFSLDFIRLFHYEFKRGDRIPMSYFKNHYYSVDIGTVKTNFRQKKYPGQLQYSKVKEIIKAIKLTPNP